MPYIVDGYNLLHSIHPAPRRGGIHKEDPWHGLPARPATARRFAGTSENTAKMAVPLISDVRLCRVISGYLKLIDEKGEIVFDGTGPRDKGGFDNISNLEVVFAGLRSDADTVIEEKIKASTAPKRLTIVSSDRRLRDAARKRKAITVKSQVFWDDVQKQLSRKRKVKEPPAKRRGISESETEQWLDFFGLE